MKYAFTRTLLVAALGASPTYAGHQSGHITMEMARARALKMVPHGRIKSAELEREHGKLIYSFDIIRPGRTGIDEIQISATDGRLVSRVHETPAMEQKEARADARNHQTR